MSETIGWMLPSLKNEAIVVVMLQETGGIHHRRRHHHHEDKEAFIMVYRPKIGSGNSGKTTLPMELETPISNRETTEEFEKIISLCIMD